MTRRLTGIVLFILTVLFIIALGLSWGSVPSIGRLISPSHGFWANIDGEPEINYELKIKGPKGTATVIYDERGVPHIFADSEDDLYFAQGYVIARDRLWQMEFVSYVASGRLSEIVGEKALPLDRYNRRIGLLQAAEASLPILLEDPVTKVPVTAFTAGVNKFIKEAKRGKLPVEYKILGYQPEEWQVLNSALLLKYMANDLTGTDNDIEFTNALHAFGREAFDLMYPDYPSKPDPIIPLETPFNFSALPAPKAPVEKIDSIQPLALYRNPLKGFLPQRGLGSNNWAVSGTKTASGRSILCNDPHLSLSLPSIWYEMQLTGPGINVYGVTLPGSPGIIIGYNNKISWGVTNAGMDIRDWYTVTTNSNDTNQYKIGNEWKEFVYKEEVYKVKGGKDLTETIRWTAVGPIVYDAAFDTKKDKQDLAMSWLALKPSNDLKTFYLLNRAQNHKDYLEALNQYWCPAQNFVYADAQNIAIKEQGRFWIRRPEQGKFIQDLAKANLNQIENYFIPNEQNPYVLNPARGFVSSANQIPAGKNYPYYVLGFDYENHRNRRINEVLTSLTDVTVDDMKKLQYDNLSILARENLPYMLSKVSRPASGLGKTIHQSLSKWDFMTDYESHAASYFYKWWEFLEKTAWDELDNQEASFTYPKDYVTGELLQTHPDFKLFDIQHTPEVENAAAIIRIAFDSTRAWFDQHPDKTEFRNFKNTTLRHLTQLDAFSTQYIKIGGYGGIVNATSSRWGASVRFIIDFADGKVQGYGMYPGGQSGNPGSAAYTAFADAWTEGKYYKHHFFPSLQEAQSILQK